VRLVIADTGPVNYLILIAGGNSFNWNSQR
jgi:hypothetical protein